MNKIILAILLRLVGELSPTMREKIKAWLDDLEKHAAETKNIADDILVAVLRAILAVD